MIYDIVFPWAQITVSRKGSSPIVIDNLLYLIVYTILIRRVNYDIVADCVVYHKSIMYLYYHLSFTGCNSKEPSTFDSATDTNLRSNLYLESASFVYWYEG